jgi:DNA-binding response OmpR family regulator
MSAADPAATILLVEDDAPTRTFLADNLTADGYQLLVADCARDGLRLLETKFPDVAPALGVMRGQSCGHR